MANKFKSVVKIPRLGGALIKNASSVQSSAKEVIFVRSGQPPSSPPPPPPPGQQACSRAAKFNREAAIEEEADDVIDLGAPRRLRLRPAGATDTAAPRPARRRALPPNPRLYPGPEPKPKPRPRRAEPGRARRGKRALRRPVPNSRLYRPAPPRPPAPPPPPLRPRAAWPPPAPPRALDTASRAALRLRPASPGRRAARPATPPPPPARRLVVTLPAAAARFQPASEHFRARSTGAGSGESTPPAARLRPRAMEAAGRRSASPEDRSEGNETLSAPSEFLAEFLSAIMRRQYAEALKYCRLILQYEPHNATARGFYPLLRHKVARAQRTEAAAAAAAADGADSSSDEACAGADHQSAGDSPSRQVQGCGNAPRRTEEEQQQELMEHSAESEGESQASAAGDHSELELDSSDALHSSPSLSLSRRTDDSAAGCWESTGSEPDAADDNGNAPPHHRNTTLTPAPLALLPDDLENENAASGEPHHSSRLKSESVSSLRRLRAQFACSIK